MNRRTTLAITTTALLCFAIGSAASPSLAQQTSLKEQLVGTWTLVSSDQMRPDGSKLKQFGANPNGINVFDANGRFFLMMASADNSRIASNDRHDAIRGRRPYCRIDRLLRHVHRQRGSERYQPSS
jgi:Lipocalin-like domain